ncbi:hypothetical protein [Spirosoma pomorum]|jgi:hypothetical protein
MNIKILVWLRNLILILLLVQVGYFLFVKYYKGIAVEWNSSSFFITAAAFALLGIEIRRRTVKS